MTTYRSRATLRAHVIDHVRYEGGRCMLALEGGERIRVDRAFTDAWLPEAGCMYIPGDMGAHCMKREEFDELYERVED